MEVRIQYVSFTKERKEKKIIHNARIVTYVDEKKRRLISLLTSANAIKIRVWVTLIANLLLMIMKKGLIRSWSFSGLATMG